MTAICEDVFCTGYVGGEGSELYANAEAYTTDLQEDNIGTAAQKASIIAWPINKGCVACRSEAIDLTGKFSQRERKTLVSRGSDLHFTNADKLYTLLGLQEIEPQRNMDDFLMPVKQANTVMFRGHCFSDKTGQNVVKQVGKGHWGVNTYPGVRAARTGLGAYIKECDWGRCGIPPKNVPSKGQKTTDIEGEGAREDLRPRARPVTELRAADMKKRTKKAK